MLKFLFSNTNIERILLFLFVNEKGYGSQIQTLLKIPLTPIQNALARLERGQIIQSQILGNKKIYQLNESYPLFEELESLLKKAYTILSSDEKKYYCFIHKPKASVSEELNRDQSIRLRFESFWKRLSQVKNLELSVRSKQQEHRENKVGKAQIEIAHPLSNQVIFTERGYWYEEGLPKTAFSNHFRWTLDLKANLVTLEHLRYGLQKPTFLFHLTLLNSKALVSLDAHLCHQDTYLGELSWSAKAIEFNWRVIGPQKNQFLHYQYS